MLSAMLKGHCSSGWWMGANVAQGLRVDCKRNVLYLITYTQISPPDGSPLVNSGVHCVCLCACMRAYVYVPACGLGQNHMTKLFRMKLLEMLFFFIWLGLNTINLSVNNICIVWILNDNLYCICFYYLSCTVPYQHYIFALLYVSILWFLFALTMDLRETLFK